MLVVGLGNRIFSILTYNDQAMAPVRCVARSARQVLSRHSGTHLDRSNCNPFAQNYSLFVNLITTFIFIPVGVLYIIPMARYRPDVITPEALSIPQYVWAISECENCGRAESSSMSTQLRAPAVGAFDSMAGVMQSLAISKLAAEGGLVVLLMQSAIPLSMAITKIFLKVKVSARARETGACAAAVATT